MCVARLVQPGVRVPQELGPQVQERDAVGGERLREQPVRAPEVEVAGSGPIGPDHLGLKGRVNLQLVGDDDDRQIRARPPRRPLYLPQGVEHRGHPRVEKWVADLVNPCPIDFDLEKAILPVSGLLVPVHRRARIEADNGGGPGSGETPQEIEEGGR